jgi:hypothetical protein
VTLADKLREQASYASTEVARAHFAGLALAADLLEQQRDELRVALREYGGHHRLCDIIEGGKRCSCGFEAALKRHKEAT